MLLKYALTRNVRAPTRGHPTDAGLDFYMPYDSKLTVLPRSNVLIPSGVKVEIPFGYMGLFLNKSGVASKKNLLIGAQVIDCFTKETKIWTPEGEKSIFQLKIGDIVYSISDDAEIEKDVIDAIVDTNEQEIITLCTDKGEISVTSGTRVYTKNGLKYARDLTENDEIIFCPMEFTKIKKIIKNKKAQTYDITVRNNHNFFANGFLLHNCFYSGEVHIDLHNVGDISIELSAGEKLAQMVLVPVLSCDIIKVAEEDLYVWMKQDQHRDAGGFGSTDKENKNA